jgi:hypothetical protein
MMFPKNEITKSSHEQEKIQHLVKVSLYVRPHENYIVPIVVPFTRKE